MTLTPIGAVAPAARRIKVVVADDDPLVRRIVRDTLQAAGLIVAAEAQTGREAIELTLHYRPDVLVVDLAMPDPDGMAVISRVRAGAPEVRIVVLTGARGDDSAFAALRAGADGYLTKDVSLATFPRTLEAVVAGEAAMSRHLEAAIISRLQSVPDTDIGFRPVRSVLTTRQWEVLDLLCSGASTESIAAVLTLSEETVRSHIKHILRRLDVRTRQEAIDIAQELRSPASS